MMHPREQKNVKISVIIPAYNEAENIIKVLKSLKQVTAIEEIIVISDGSTDDTVNLVIEFGGAKVIPLPQNVGKTKAVCQGVAEAEHPTIMFCDADLINLNQNHISNLAYKYFEGFDMVIMDKGSQPWIFKKVLKSVPAISGTRILDKAQFLKVPFQETDRFQFENRINDYFLENDLTIAISPGEGIYDRRKFVKYSFFRGLILDLKGGLEVIASDGPSSILRNLATFRKISALAESPKNSKRRRHCLHQMWRMRLTKVAQFSGLRGEIIKRLENLQDR